MMSVVYAATNGLEQFVVEPKTPISEAISILTRTEADVLLLCENDQQLVGTLSCDDIRQAILEGVSLKEPCLRIADLNPITASKSISRREAMHLMNGQEISSVKYLPLVDEKGRVVNLLSQEGWLQKDALPLSAVIMAGGFGSRLRPLTNDLPKPLLPIGDRPIMELIIEQLRDVGIQQFYVTTHYLPEKIINHFGNGRSFGIDITYVSEDTPLGTAGALGLLENPNRPLLVINGDILTQLDFRAMWSFHRNHRAPLTVAVRPYELQVPYGVMESEGPYLRQISEKPRLNFLVNAGIYLLEPSVLAYIPVGRRFDMTDLIQALLDSSLRVANFPMIEYWLDIGKYDDYQQAQKDFQNGNF
ncbi:nucleotidyltransferase family protein [Moorena sp. SIO3A2]|uniref:nucleotidyltransferase family protein n=1 Tax=Moorena sp. SIO3A2 TaxID=2607841 RepID=UPI0013BE7EA7|nr:nucleotidyltransferase family protein [Moorena sp. SIO3A2]NER87930.1 NTP transferase domain-containing protein [Moorena sp. SIO3A2]